MHRTGVPFRANDGNDFAATRMERIEDPNLYRRTPGSMTLLRQAQAIITQRRGPIRVPDHLGERLDIAAKPFLPILAHAPFPPRQPF